MVGLQSGPRTRGLWGARPGSSPCFPSSLPTQLPVPEPPAGGAPHTRCQGLFLVTGINKRPQDPDRDQEAGKKPPGPRRPGVVRGRASSAVPHGPQETETEATEETAAGGLARTRSEGHFNEMAWIKETKDYTEKGKRRPSSHVSSREEQERLTASGATVKTCETTVGDRTCRRRGVCRGSADSRAREWTQGRAE